MSTKVFQVVGSLIQTDTTLSVEGVAADAAAVGEALSNIDVQDEIYIGSGDMPEGYTLQINPEGSDLVFPEIPSPTIDDAGKFLRVSSAGAYALETVPNAEEASF